MISKSTNDWLLKVGIPRKQRRSLLMVIAILLITSLIYTTIPKEDDAIVSAATSDNGLNNRPSLSELEKNIEGSNLKKNEKINMDISDSGNLDPPQPVSNDKEIEKNLKVESGNKNKNKNKADNSGFVVDKDLSEQNQHEKFESDAKMNTGSKEGNKHFDGKDPQKVLYPDNDISNDVENSAADVDVSQIGAKDNRNGEAIKKKVQKLNEQKISNKELKLDIDDKEKNSVLNDDEDIDKYNPADEFNLLQKKSPIVIFSKTYCPYSKKLKALLSAKYSFDPEPIIIELDNHKNGSELQKYVGKVTGRKTVPNLIINGVSRGGCDDILELDQNGELSQALDDWAGRTLSVTPISSKL
ncbi:glutathione-disulfide reductase [Martiniozyma asiatica (nom. inval.)]|nr:glutathione-disulfide reductase [Martiniozyma asiatica]